MLNQYQYYISFFKEKIAKLNIFKDSLHILYKKIDKVDLGFNLFYQIN
jgi:hypothetical protein